MAVGVAVWSTTAATNASADSGVNWAEGQAPSSVNDSARAMMRAVALWRNDLNGSLTTAGTSTAYTLTSNQTFGALTAGYEITFCLDETNGATVTINVDSLGAKPLRPSPNVEFTANALKAGVPYRATYYTTNSGEWIVHGLSHQKPLTDLQIAGASALTAPATDDAIGISDTSDSGNNKKITLSDTLKVINSLTEDSSPDSAADFVVSYDESASGPKKVKLQNLPAVLSRNYIDGCEISNGTDATNDINIAAGVCRDSTNTVDIIVSATSGKQLDANWAAGAAAGMRNSAAGITNATYHIYAGRTAASAAADFYAYAGADGTDPDSSAAISTMLTAWQAESGGASYAYARRIGSIIRSGGSILAFSQKGNEFLFSVPVADHTGATIGTSASLLALTVPAGIKAGAKVYATFLTSNTKLVLISSPDQTDSDPSSISNMRGQAANQNPSLTEIIRTNTSRQIRARASVSTGAFFDVLTFGWIDARGRS